MCIYKTCISIVLFSFIVSCSTGVKTVNFILPENFRGFIVVSENAREGQELHFQDNTTRIVVPKSGKVTVTSMKVFTEGVNDQFYLGATKIESNNLTRRPEAIEVEDLGRNAIETSNTGIETGGEITYMVGNLAERRKLWEEHNKKR